MSDISLVCMREDAYRADQLAGALERYGFSVCRSASVFEDFQGYAAVVVLLSPGAARSELVMGTAERAMDYGKLIPVFVNLCRLPDRLAGVPLHDLSAWDGAEDDRVLQAIAYHAQRLAGLPGRPDLGPPTQRRALLEDSSSLRQPRVSYDPSPSWEPQQYGYNEPVHEPRFVATAYNEIDSYGAYDGAHEGSILRPIDEHVIVSPNDHGQRQHRDHERSYFQPTHTVDYAYEEESAPRSRRRPLPSILTMVVCAMALMGTAWFEEARTREVAQLAP
ncbi:MAG: hypothetical protein FD124_3213, partial [Alphaproteobacteria bacterium]